MTAPAKPKKRAPKPKPPVSGFRLPPDVLAMLEEIKAHRGTGAPGTGVVIDAIRAMHETIFGEKEGRSK